MSFIIGEGFEFTSDRDAFIGAVPGSATTAFAMLFISPASARKMARALLGHATRMEDGGIGLSEDDARWLDAIERDL